MILTPRTPVRRRRPHTARTNPWKIVFAHFGWTRSNTVTSTELVAFAGGRRGHRGEQPIASRAARQRVEGPYVRQSLGDRLRDTRPPEEVPDVSEGLVRASLEDAADLGVTNAMDVLQSQPDSVHGCWPRGERFLSRVDEVAQLGCAIRAAREGPDLSSGLYQLDHVLGLREIHIQWEDGNPVEAGVLEDQSPRIHPWFVRQHSRQEVRRVVCLQVRGLVRGDGERCRVRLAEPERGEREELLPDPFGLRLAQASCS
jgi:hypothetical protein